MKSNFLSSGLKFTFMLIVTTILLGMLLLFNSHDKASAAPITDFNAGNIISDTVFYNKNSMSVQQIQNFLNNLIPNCDTWGAQSSEYGGGTRAQYAISVGWPGPPYPCLNVYHENPNTNETSYEKGGGAFSGGISAAQIIYNASQQYGINPQILLVMLKKESAGPLTADTWPLKSQYKYAMGYACPDSGGANNVALCNDKQAGFYKQMMTAAWQLKYYKDHPNDYRYHIGWNDIQYSPDASCGTKQVNIENMATLSLYIYTPYTPNDGALANYPGTAPCGAYGNRNFYQFFREWFGNPRVEVRGAIGVRYTQLGGISSILGNPVYNEYTPDRWQWWQEFEKGIIIANPITGTWESLGPIRTRWSELGYQTGKMGYPAGPITTVNNGKTSWQAYQNGAIIWNEATGAWESKGAIREYWGSIGYQSGRAGFPTGPEVYDGTTQTTTQTYQNGIIHHKPGTGVWFTES